jgi:hypothetical protein
MKQLCLLIIILLAAPRVDGQKIRFTDTSNVWMEISSSSDGASYRHYSIGSDTTIGTYQYKNITVSLPSWTYNNMAAREDTTGKVFFLIDSTEILMYDFSMQMGDTFRMINQQDTFLHFLSGIDSVTIGIDTYKVFNLSFISTSKPNGSGMNYKAIEGIGCVEGFLLPHQPTYGLAVTKLLCFTAKGTSPEVIPSVQHFDNKTSCKVSVENVISDKQNITISPHPANAVSVIILPYILQKGELIIYNTLGQIIRQVSINNTSKLTIGQLPGAGMYYYRVNDKTNGKIWQGKVVYE